MKLQKCVLKIVPILAVTHKKAMGSLKVNSREIQIAGGFRQGLGEMGLRYQPPCPTLPPTPSPQLHPLIFFLLLDRPNFERRYGGTDIESSCSELGKQG